MKIGLIKKQISNQYIVINEKTGEEFNAIASGKLRFVRVSADDKFNVSYGRHTKTEHRHMKISPKVGDRVHYNKGDTATTIEEVLPRRNDLKRPDVANVDQVLLLFSATNPAFSFHLLDRFLVVLKQQHLEIILVVSKIDLVSIDELTILREQLKYYEDKVAIPIYYIDSKKRLGFDVLEDIFKDKITVLAGQTGVGKSTLLNSLIPSLNIKTQEISKALGRGKHTTRHSELYDFGGGYICDTPGFSRLDMNMYELIELKDVYEDFKIYEDQCKFSTCMHINEPNCGVKEAVENKKIPQERYENYIMFYEEIKANKDKY